MSRQPLKTGYSEQGFSIIELVMVIVITGILAGVTSQVISKNVEQYIAITKRAGLVDTAEISLQHISRTIRQAMPYSVRLHANGQGLELLHTRSGGLFRLASRIGFNDNILTIGSNDNQFDVLGPFHKANTIALNQDILAIYKSKDAAYQLDNTATITSCNRCDIQVSREGLDQNAPVQLGFNATTLVDVTGTQRFFVIDTPVTFICDLNQNTLRRFDHYTITAALTNVDSPAELNGLVNPAESNLLAENVTGCLFYGSATDTDRQLITISLTISDQSEQISLLHQIQVVNAP